MKQYKITTTYRWSVDYEYDTVRNCGDSCEHICRCSKIENAVVTEGIDIPEMSIRCNRGKNNTFVKHKLSVVERYCIDRIAVYCGIYEPSNYELMISNGYYGEEIGDVKFEYDEEFKQHIIEMLMLETNYSKILYVLGMEYSFVPDKLSDTTHRVDIVKLKLSDVDHDLFKEGFVRKEHTDYFKEVDTSIPIGILHGKRLVDGNNRLLHLLSRCGSKSLRKFQFIKIS